MKYQTCILSNEEGAIMGLFNKLKNVLFEEEEIEVPETELPEVEPIKEREKEPVKKKEASNLSTYRVEDEIMSDRELFKAEPTFNFPLFDEAEFESVKQVEEKKETPTFEPPMEPKTRVKNTPVVEPTTRASRSESRIEKTSVYKENRKPREVREKKEKREGRKFTPSPVISPVYGVLDKNYKKEDVVAPKEEKKRIDVDSVRKKAFGTLEEDIEKTLNTPIREFYDETPEYEEQPKFSEKPKKNFYETEFPESTKDDDIHFDHLLHDSVEDVIPVYDEEPNEAYSSFNIEEPVKSMDEEEEKSLEILDRPKRKQETKEKVEDTLENDLFDLIDSMYENREDGE